MAKIAILTIFGEKCWNMMGRPPGIVVGPGKVLGAFYGENFFFPDFEIFQNFFFKMLSVSHGWPKFFGNLIFYRVDMTLWFDEKKIFNFPNFWKFSLVNSFSLFDAIWCLGHQFNQILSVPSESSDIISTFDMGLVLSFWLFYISHCVIKVFGAHMLLYKVPFFQGKIFFSVIYKSSQIWYHEHMQNFRSKSVKTKKFC